MVRTLNEIFSHTVKIERPAILKYKKDGRWIDVSIPRFEQTVRNFSCGLRQLGVQPGDRVAIISETRPEWTLSDFAILAANAITVPIYPTLLAKQVEFLLKDSSAVVLLGSTPEQIAKVQEIRGNCPALRSLIVFEGKGSAGVLSFDDVLDTGRTREAREGRSVFDELLRRPKPDDLATIVYTSGTTGSPKGAMLTHGNITSNVVSSCEVVPFRDAKLTIAFLPLSHIFERMVDMAYLYVGAGISYAESVVKLPENLVEVRPHAFAAAPRVFEKMYVRIMDMLATAPASKQKIFRWALGVARRRLPYRVVHKSPPPLLALQGSIAHLLVFRKILARLGGRIRMVFSGSAPLSQELAEFFIGAGLEIYEGYGLTETSPVITVNTPEHRKLGTVGKPIPGVEVKIAPDGEILTRGPHVMKGYWNNPQATAEVIDAQGWFHTGDIGEIDEEGFLKITDRKKDLIVSAYGKNIAPQPIEAVLKTSPYIATPVLIGDRRKFLSALIVPHFERLERAAGVTGASRAELVRNPKVRELIEREIERVNKDLAPYEQVKRFELLAEDFSVEGGDLTPSFKVKRKEVDKKYKPVIDRMYEEPPTPQSTTGRQ
jgi:long-chain acyl-CoA synthetase